MICEIIREPKGAKGIINLGRYVVGAERGSDPASWDRLTSYVLGVENEKGEIVADVRTTNCQASEIGLAVKEMAIANDQNVITKASKAYHFVISLVPGESLTPAQFKVAEQRYINALGMEGCKRISATHLSKEHMHRHVVVATASGRDGKNIRPKHDYAKVALVSQELEKQFGLTIVNHERGTGRAMRDTFLAYARDRADDLKAAKTWAELHNAAGEHGMYVKPRGAGMVIGSLANRMLNVRASKVDPELSFKAITDRLGAFELDGQAREGQQYSDAFADYKAKRKAHKQGMASKIKDLRTKQVAEVAELAEFYRKRVENELKLQLPHQKQARRLNVGIIVKQREAAHRKLREDHLRERRALSAENSFPTFAQTVAAQEHEREDARERTMERHA